MSGEISVTYESLFELVLREKSNKELQLLPKEFLQKFSSYVEKKKEYLSTTGGDIFSDDEKDATIKQLRNIYRLINELYERREKKIIGIALVRSKTGQDLIDTTNLLAHEKDLFEELIKIFDVYREKNMSLLTKQEIKKPKPSMEKKEALENAVEVKQVEEAPTAADTKVVKFLEIVDEFVGEELEKYGPYNKEDIATLPLDIAELLVNKGSAEIVE